MEPHQELKDTASVRRRFKATSTKVQQRRGDVHHQGLTEEVRSKHTRWTGRYETASFCSLH
ncbi:hypothetical protein ZHAS_00021228 [Anopheles sinensis]|uniref:Uncharacterized protein n=1 Tax=Anopheles sinensis TaxID=74873 RepID=A0A084WRV5_ANOSI|nr:hypothetical protein ZHAS_00021228 [Anopheles sinensis]